MGDCLAIMFLYFIALVVIVLASVFAYFLFYKKLKKKYPETPQEELKNSQFRLKYCINCGADIDKKGKCTNCGAKY